MSFYSQSRVLCLIFIFRHQGINTIPKRFTLYVLFVFSFLTFSPVFTLAPQTSWCQPWFPSGFEKVLDAPLHILDQKPAHISKHLQPLSHKPPLDTKHFYTVRIIYLIVVTQILQVSLLCCCSKRTQMFGIKIIQLALSPGRCIVITNHLWACSEAGIFSPTHCRLLRRRADSIMMQKGVFEKPGSFLIKPHTHTYL